MKSDTLKDRGSKFNLMIEIAFHYSQRTGCLNRHQQITSQKSFLCVKLLYAAFAAGVVITLIVGYRLCVSISEFGLRPEGSGAVVVRNLFPWRYRRWFAPLFPIVALVFRLQVVKMAPYWVQTVLFILTFSILDVFKIAVSSEMWIAQYEEELIPKMPLGARPLRPTDVRLHYATLISVYYGVILLGVGLQIQVPEEIEFSSVFILMFCATFLNSVGCMYERVVHHQMHSGVLRFQWSKGQTVNSQRFKATSMSLQQSSFLTQFWTFMLEHVPGLLCGYIPGLYALDHMHVHHEDHGGEEDLHSTMPFNRNSLFEYCIFSFEVMLDVNFGAKLFMHPYVQQKASRMANVAKCIGLYWGAMAAVWWSTKSILVPWLIAIALEHGVSVARYQYLWHGLADSEADPKSKNYEHATTVQWMCPPGAAQGPGITAFSKKGSEIDGSGHWAFFDNLHLTHHMYPQIHFTEYPGLFERDFKKFRELDVLILDLNYYDEHLYNLLTGDVDAIAMYLDYPDKSIKEKVKLLKRRLGASQALRHPCCAVTDIQWVRDFDMALARSLKFAVAKIA